jgi:hypothetical protein
MAEEVVKKTPTPEEAQKSVLAALDSVTLINKKVLEEKTEERKKTVERNVKHLTYMLTKDWFTAALTAPQRASIDTAITDGNAYCA